MIISKRVDLKEGFKDSRGPGFEWYAYCELETQTMISGYLGYLEEERFQKLR